MRAEKSLQCYLYAFVFVWHEYRGLILRLLLLFFFFLFFFWGRRRLALAPRLASRGERPAHLTAPPCAPPASAEANARSSWDRTVLAMRGKTVSWFLLAPLRVILMVVPTGTKRHRR